MWWKVLMFNIYTLTFHLLFLNLHQICAFFCIFYTFFQLIFVENFSLKCCDIIICKFGAILFSFMKCLKIGQFDLNIQVILKIKVIQPKASALIRRICQLAKCAIVKADAFRLYNHYLITWNQQRNISLFLLLIHA